MRLTSAEYAAIRRRKQTRMLEQEVADQERAARTMASKFGFDDNDEHPDKAAPVTSAKVSP